MKLKLLLGIALLVGGLHASDANLSNLEEPIGPSEPFKVRSLSDEAINAYCEEYIATERTRSTVRRLATGAAVAGGLYSLGYWLFKDPATDPVTRVEHGALATKVAGVEAQLNAPPQAAPQGWFDWMQAKAIDAGSFIYSFIPGLAVGYIAQQVSQLIYGGLPSVGSYLIDETTLGSCLTRKTMFLHSTRNLINWSYNVIMQPTMPRNNNELVICANQFVAEMEKVLGVMGYMLTELDKEDT